MAKLSPIKVELYATIEPGSEVLIAVDRPLTVERAQRMTERLGERFPGVEFTFVEANAIAVMPPKPDDD